MVKIPDEKDLEKNKRENRSENRQEDLQRILNRYDADIKKPNPNEIGKESREYKQFEREEIKSQKKSWYEILCNLTGKIYTLPPDKSTREETEKYLKLTELDANPGEIMTLTLVITLSLFLLAIPVFMTPIDTLYKALYLIVPIFAAYYIFYYPKNKAEKKMINSADELVLSILYMTVYMRSSPNIEGAIKFAALNLRGPVAHDLKKILWEVEVGKYKTINHALDDYVSRWKPFNKEYVESIRLLRATTSEGSKTKRRKMFKEAIDNILEGTQERMKHFAQGLKLPVMILNGVGVLLPILGMIIIPMGAIFMGDAIKPMYLILFYNVLLPAFLLWFINKTLSKRPPSVAKILPSEKYLPPRGKYVIHLKDREIKLPIWVLSVFILILLGGWSLGHYAQLEVLPKDPGFIEIMRSLSLIVGSGFAIGIYFILGYRQRLKKEEEIREIESEFPEALFQLSNKISGGNPLVVAINESLNEMNDLKIQDLFIKISNNIKNFGMTFEQALFDEEFGALLRYPSKLIEAVMTATISASEKGVSYASSAMKTVSRYLKNLHKTQETINDLLEEVKSTMVFLAYILAPVISAVAIAMTQVMEKALYVLSQTTGGFETGTGSARTDIIAIDSILKLKQAIPPELLQLIVGGYVVEISIILGVFITRISEGNDPTRMKYNIGKIIIVSTVVYAITLVILTRVFGGLFGMMIPKD